MTAADTKGYANPHLLITPEALAPLLRSERPDRPTLIDLRPAEQFAAGHLPHAVHLDLFGLSLVDTDAAPLRAYLWMIEHLFATRGVRADRPVVVYDEVSGIRAARAFWFLELFGHPQVRLLDGGVRGWTAAGQRLTTEAEAPEATDWHGERVLERLATWKDVLDRLARQDAALLDTRTVEEHRGTLVRAARGGTIPGSVHLEWTENLGPQGAFKPAADLRAMYDRAGITPDREVVSYCQGGYRGAHSYLALRLLGYPRVRNYLGSWREWGDRTDLPIEAPSSRD
ncbi:MAG TPA: sulfurtransferase [Methylomirabilota bacterium]